MKITANAELCTGHGRCYTLAPDLLSDDEEGYVTIRGQFLDVPADQLQLARRAVANCPEKALELIED
jgi:ferredoxin